MSPRQVGLGAAVAVAAAALSGCVVFKSEPSARQQHVIGSVQITIRACASQTGRNGTPPPGSCANQGNTQQDAPSGKAQLFLAFRLPQGTHAPRTFTATTGPGRGPKLDFARNASYRGQLQTLDPAPAGEEWIGYVSQYVTYRATKGPQRFLAKPVFGLPPGRHGAPFSGPFTYRVGVGGRSNAHPHPHAPVNCMGSLTAGSSLIHGSIICIDDPSSTTLATDDSLATRDAAILAGKRVSVAPGHSAKAKFKFEYAGTRTHAARFSFSAKTGVAGASAKPSVAQLTPASNSTTPVTVTVKVPAGAHAGTYEVKLIARLANGETRTGTVVLKVR